MHADIATQTLRALRRIMRATEIGSRQLAAATGLAAHMIYIFNISVLGLLGHTLMGLSRRTPEDG